MRARLAGRQFIGLSGLALPEDGGSYPDMGRTGRDSLLEICAHSH
jgi:hypothetical protein